MKPNYRRCVSCRQILPKEQLWRIVRVHPSHSIVLDEGMGRSAYICPQADCLQQARQKNRLGRSLKAKIPDQIYQSLQQKLKINLEP
ncbi:MAG: YlxR family protein [Xenococcaceae cyanobacterium MO_207.B15]|nr:YlxR family protein [Xenococcaceae cyanobacterium MO_207.B15]MDJ0746477.1 YlxR family protein [Xenococcaceae cyanobacterium MO_167.B27]